MEDTSVSLNKVVAGCRKSELALVQAHHIVTQIAERTTLTPAPQFEVATRSVAGDADKQSPFTLLSKQSGGSDVGKSLWTNGLEVDLLSGKFGFLIHCLKDMPTTLPPNCSLEAISEREDPTDAVIMRSDRNYTSIDQLPAGSVVGSSSSRRRALVKRNWPHLEVQECRGNLDTRLAKLDAPGSAFSCILLATAGLVRLGLGGRITQRLSPEVFPYAVGQGALGLEIRTGREDMLQLVNCVDHKPSRLRGMAERAMLRSLQGGCSSPIGVFSHFDSSGEQLHLSATVLALDGSRDVKAELSAAVTKDQDAQELGITVAGLLLERGASDLLIKPE